MPFPWAAAIAGGASLLGGILGNKSRRAESARNRDFQERAYKHRHQWQVEDLKAAGLNPILSAGGAPAGPAGSMATQEDVISPAVSSAQHARRLREDIKVLRSQVENIKSDTGNKRQDYRIKGHQANAEKARVDNIKMDSLLKAATIDMQKRQGTMYSSSALMNMKNVEAMNEELKKLKYFGAARETDWGRFLMDLENFMRSTGFKGGSIKK